jgi:hypothetical protein
MALPYLSHCSALKMRATCSSEILVYFNFLRLPGLHLFLSWIILRLKDPPPL